ncbi:MAG: class I SAM-dependent methyltransferase [Actinomycetota bacterium]
MNAPDRSPGTPSSIDVHRRLREFWDLDAETYDRSPSHAGTDPLEAACWRAALVRHLPPPPARILDAGAGTGTITVLAAELGYRVTALDLSAAMLAQAGRKADAQGLEIDIVVGPATEPPPGPFDAVVERHLVWTLPDPVAALRAWRTVAPGGRLVCYEAAFASSGLAGEVRHLLGAAVRRLRSVDPDHHDEYAADLRAVLPLAGRMRPDPLIRAVADAGWRRYRVERLRDVEGARRRAAPWPLGRIEGVPQFALLAEA